MNIGEAGGSDGRRLDIIRYKKDFMSKKMRIKIQNNGNMLKNSKIQKKFGHKQRNLKLICPKVKIIWTYFLIKVEICPKQYN